MQTNPRFFGPLIVISVLAMAGCNGLAYDIAAASSVTASPTATTAQTTVSAPDELSAGTSIPTSTPTLTATPTVSGGGASKPPAAATSAPTSVPSTAPPPVLQTRPFTPTAITGAIDGQSLSPDGKFTAVHSMSRVVITAQDGRVAYIYRMKWFRFVGWTGDSRYAVMNHYDQYGNQCALAFDTAQWKEFWIPPTSCTWQPGGQCQQGAVKILPDGSSVLLSNGASVNLGTVSASSDDCIAPMVFVFPTVCADEAPVMAQAAQQVFEGGRMLWVQNGPYYGASEIYVLLANGDAEIYRDTWTTAELQSDPSIVPPSGKYQPVMGFGKVWRTGILGTGQTVRETLGWAVAPEQSYSSFYQRVSSSSSKSLYLFAIDKRVINLFWPQAGTRTRWEFVAP